MIRHEVWLTDERGNRLILLDNIEMFQWTRIVNGIGRCTIILKDDLPEHMIDIDRRIEIRRAPEDKEFNLENYYFIRRPERDTDQNNINRLTVYSLDPNELLKRRIVAYAAGSAQANKTDFIDDMMKEIVYENLGAGAIAARDMTGSGFTIAPDAGLGPSITKSFARRNVLTILQDLSDIARNEGTEVYFAVVPNGLDFRFETYIGQPGLDRTYDTADPIIFSLEFGNLLMPTLEEDFEDEVNYVYGGGQGEGVGRTIVEVNDAVRINRSIWNRREAFRDARHEATAAGVEDEAQARLAEGRPKRRFAGILISTPTTRYGTDWNLGDRCGISYAGQQFDGLIRAISGSVNREGFERVEARVEVEDVA